MSLTLLLLIPALFAVICGFAPVKSAKIVALAGSGITFALALLVLIGFNDTSGYRLLEQHAWFPALNIGYNIGADGPGLLMVVLTAFLSLIDDLVFRR